MNDRPHADMLEAARFVQAGRLTEATALLQRLLGGGAPAPETASADPAGAPPAGRAPRVIDLAPETIEVTEQHRPAPPTTRALGTNGAAGSWPVGGTAATAQPPLPEALRGFLERFDGGGFEAGLGGLAEPFPAPAPEPLPDGAKFLAGSYADQAGSRAYKLYVPSGHHGQALPLVVMLHGCTQSPDDFAAGTRMNLLAEEHTCLVAYPAQPSSANASKCWNWFSPGDQQRDRGEPSLIAGITRRIMADHPVDPARVYVAGLSAGGAAAAIMGAAYPDLYAAVGVHSGLAVGAASDLPSAFAAMRGGAAATAGGAARSPAGRVPAEGQRRIVPTIVFHGDRDTTVHPRNGDQVIAQARGTATAELQATATVQQGQAPGGRAYRRTLHADAGGRAVLEQWVVRGAGHAWSGGSLAGSYTDPQGPDASREMLRFFLEHPHPTAAAAPSVH
jgi:poly(hydroxyalkanoate) depolymerase family esterase